MASEKRIRQPVEHEQAGGPCVCIYCRGPINAARRCLNTDCPYGVFPGTPNCYSGSHLTLERYLSSKFYYVNGVGEFKVTLGETVEPEESGFEAWVSITCEDMQLTLADFEHKQDAEWFWQGACEAYERLVKVIGGEKPICCDDCTPALHTDGKPYCQACNTDLGPVWGSQVGN